MMETPPACEPEHAAGMNHHFGVVDPHEAVAASKASFYAQALDYLNSHIPRRPRTLLDVGCGFGYFLAAAAAAGWQTIGVDILSEAMSTARSRLPEARLVEGDLRSARLADGSLDAVTMWDVLDMVPDPAAELEECRRVLAPGGCIGIRVRNMASQLRLYRCYIRFGWLARRFRISSPFTFHRFSFTRKAIVHLLAATGFSDINCLNSPLTQGDPYHYSSVRGLAGFAKFWVAALSGLASRLSCGRVLIGPSLLVWAQKPLVDP
jgi:SAM-dependent methyltransferase